MQATKGAGLPGKKGGKEMTLHDLIWKASELAMQLPSGDVPLSKDIDFTIATYKGESFIIIVDVKEPEK